MTGVRRGGVDGLGAGVEDRLAGDPQRRGRVDDVVDDDRRLALDVTDDVADLGDLLGGRPLSRIARSAPSFEANFLLSFTRPASGATTTRSFRPRSRKCCVRMKIAVMWSTGLEKKPWIWPACGPS